MKIIYTATAGIAVPLLKTLAKDERFQIMAINTREDKPAGRNMELQASPVKRIAKELGMLIFQPKDINDANSVAKLQELGADLMIVFAYGQILSTEVLNVPKHGCVNVHASLLPRHRGASPVQSALLAGDTETGVSLMKMEKKMDSGPVYNTFSIPVQSNDNAITLTEKIAYLAAEKTPDILASILTLNPEAQDEGRTTYCKKIKKSDGEINWQDDAEAIARRIRAYAGWPGTYTTWCGRLFKIIDGDMADADGEPGMVTQKDGQILVGTGKGSIRLKSVQMEGKTVQNISEFIKGHSDFICSRLESF